MRRAVATVLAAFAVVLSALTTVPAQAAGSDTVHVTSRHSIVTRGGEVRERVSIRVDATARVNLHVVDNRHSRYVRGRVDLGTLSPGWHYWTWTGHQNGGGKAPDGRYQVVVNVTFTGSGRYLQTGVDAFVHRHYHSGSVTTSHPTIYPRSTTVHDATSLGVRPPEELKMTMRVRSRAGRVVLTRAYRVFHSFLRVRWDGRDARNRALPAGTYYVSVRGVDRDGFRGSTKARAVKLSTKKLVTAERTVTLSASASLATYQQPRGCNGCGEPPQPCGTVSASARFAEPGALTYRSAPAPCADGGSRAAGARHLLVTHEDAPRGYGGVGVSLFGGPTTLGAGDQGELVVYAPSTTSARVTTPHPPSRVSTGPDTSDHTTTADEVTVGPISDDYTDEPGPGVMWAFYTADGASYDVATFTVRYTFLTPG